MNEMNEILKEYTRLYSLIEKKAKTIFDYYSKKHMCGDEYLTHVEIDSGEAILYWEAYWAYGGHDSGTVSMPLEVFGEDNWKSWVDGPVSTNRYTFKK